MSQFTKEYKTFFESPAGQYYLRFLNDQIQSEHMKAEDNPDMSRDHVQRAKGLRIAIEHIDSMSIEREPSVYKK